MKRRIILLLLAVIILASPLGAFAKQASDFDSHYAKQSIEYLFNNKIVQGYEDGSFRPENEITRAEFITIINRAFSFSESQDISFSDVPKGAWYYDEIKKAVAAGYIQGYEDGTMRPGKNISRQEAAVVLYRILAIDKTDIASLSSMLNTKNIPSWSAEAVASIIWQQLMDLKAPKDFLPTTNLTRADMAIAIERSLVGMISLRSDELGYPQRFITSNNPKNKLTITLDGNTINVVGNTQEQFNWAWLQVIDKKTESKQGDIKQIIDGKVNLSFDVNKEDSYTLRILYGMDRYGDYSVSLSTEFTYIGNTMQFTISPVYWHNTEYYRQKPEYTYGKMDIHTLNEEEKIIINDYVADITKGIKSDYDKVAAISHWIASNVAYDYGDDFVATIEPTAMNTLLYQRSICQGFTDLASKMFDSLGLENKMVLGYSVGSTGKMSLEESTVEQVSHTWNEVFVDNRWVIIDTTWNSDSKYQNGIITYQHDAILFNFFDMSMEMLSWKHRIWGYQD